MAAPPQVKHTGSAKPSAEELAALTIAQDLWGQGNFSPLDETFEAQALVTMPPTKKSKLAVVAPNMGRKLQRYSKESGVWVDAFESAPELARHEREKGVKAAFKVWDNLPASLGTAKFTEVLVFQAGRLCDDLPDFYGRVVKSLRPKGSVFVADLTGAPRANRSDLRARAEHRGALEGAGLRISNEVDLTREVMLKIRRGFQHNTEKLAALRQLDEPTKRQMTVAFCMQLERWAKTALLLEAGKIAAFGWRGDLSS